MQEDASTTSEFWSSSVGKKTDLWDTDREFKNLKVTEWVCPPGTEASVQKSEAEADQGDANDWSTGCACL